MPPNEGANNGQQGLGTEGGGPAAGGNGTGAPQGNSGASGTQTQPGVSNGGNTGANGTGNPGASSSGASGVPANWQDSISPEIRDQIGNIQNYKTVEDFAKSYVNAQKMVGADKIPVPGPHTTPEEWKVINQKLGVPEKVEDYKVEIDKAFEGQIDKDFFGEFTKAAHENGMRPNQAKAVAEWFAKVNTEAQAAQVKLAEKLVADGFSNLKKEWGGAYDEKFNQANSAFKELLTKEQQDMFTKSGLHQNAEMIKIFASIGSKIGEGTIKGESGTGVGGAVTPQQARAELDAIKGNLKHPYYDAQHAEHAAAKARVTSLYTQAFPPQQKT